ncbi:VWA domain-containing protein [Pyrinomonas sp.]|uniref:VWA domain-containing protein n=1 Tax=Pyrinomonas sp. TaxID=2080306 RepID=UPI003326AE4F
MLQRSVPFMCLLFVALVVSEQRGRAQQREIPLPVDARLTVRNREGRIKIVALEEQKAVTLVVQGRASASSAEEAVTVRTVGRSVEIEPVVDKERVDLLLRVPTRARVRAISGSGAIDLIGDFREAAAETDTGTVHLDVPVEALSYDFVWTASRPRYLSEMELAKPREVRGGKYELTGYLGEKKAPADKRVRVEVSTRRGVVLFGVDPELAPADLRERRLTEAARAMIRSGNEDLIAAVRKIVPRLVDEYVGTLPPHEGPEPRLVARASELHAAAGARLARFNVSVRDRRGATVDGLRASDFIVLEDGQQRPIVDVQPTTAPFNLVLLLDVSGSVEEKLDFIRKAALAFIETIGPQDRLAIVSFRDDVQKISDFTTDKQLLAERVKQIEAGGATALYDALAYVLIETLRPLRNERTAVVVLSDGDDNRSFLPFAALLELVSESGAIIYPLYVPSELIPAKAAAAERDAADPVRARYMALTSRASEEGQQLAAASGGVFFTITRLEDLQRAYDGVVAQLRAAYTITYLSQANEGHAPLLRVRIRRQDAVATSLGPVTRAQ